MLNKYLPVWPSKTRSLLLVGSIIFIYLLDNLPKSSFIDYTTYNNILKPILWTGLAGLVLIFPRIRSRASLKLRGSIDWWAIIFAFINIVILFFAGLIDGFGKSPYDHSLKGFLINLLAVGLMLAGREAVRSYTVNSLAVDEKFLVFIPIALFMTLSNFAINKYTSLKGYEGTVEFIAQFLAPEFAQNLLATYLAFLGGWLPAFIYMGILQAFHWFSPILPNLKWITAAVIGIICPVFSLTAMQSIYAKNTKVLKMNGKDKENPIGWMITSIISIGLIWFAVGVFPIYPSVIATGSMEPMIMPGDVILVDKITKAEDADPLKIGDVIQFRRDNILISHRIMKIIDEGKGKSYVTKGDNNSTADTELVKPEDVKGKIVSVVPKIGWPTLLLKSKDNIPLQKVEF